MVKIISLSPPLIGSKTLLHKIAATRPMREGSFQISAEVIETARGKKLVVHCYGHGGSGWTTLFGSINQALKLFQKRHGKDKTLPIRIIGSGCMGLTAAVELSLLGYKVAGITTKERFDIPSWQAAGYCALVSLKTSPEEMELLHTIGVETFLAYQAIEKGEHPYLHPKSASRFPVYCSEETEAGIEDLEMAGLIPQREKVTLDFGGGVQHPNYLKYETYFIDTVSIMGQLLQAVERLHIPIEQKEVLSFDEIKEEIIFNCTGLGAKKLNHDRKMVGVRGHLAFLNADAGHRHMDYLIYTTVEQEGRKECLYFFPKKQLVTQLFPEGLTTQGVLGGTFVQGSDTLNARELEELDVQEFTRLCNRGARFFTSRDFT